MLTSTPERVAIGLRDYIAWESRAVADVEVRTRLGRRCEVLISMKASEALPSPKHLERDLTDMLPEGYTLTMNWKADEPDRRKKHPAKRNARKRPPPRKGRRRE